MQSKLSQPIQFQQPRVKHPKKIIKTFKDSKVYNHKFLHSLEKGLTQSTYLKSKNNYHESLPNKNKKTRGNEFSRSS